MNFIVLEECIRSFKFYKNIGIMFIVCKDMNDKRK